MVEKTDLRLFRADLGPGDLLLIPSLWIHTTEVEGDKPSLGFSMFVVDLRINFAPFLQPCVHCLYSRANECLAYRQ